MPNISDFLKSKSSKKASKSSKAWKVDTETAVPQFGDYVRPGVNDSSFPSPTAASQPAPKPLSQPPPVKLVQPSADSAATRQPAKPDSVATREHINVDSVATREHKKVDSAATREHLADNSVATREQIDRALLDNPEHDLIDSVAKTKHSVAIDSDPLPSRKPTRQQIKPDSVATREQMEAHSAANRINSVAIGEITLPSAEISQDQNSTDSVADTQDTGAEEPLPLPSSGTTREQNIRDSVALPEERTYQARKQPTNSVAKSQETLPTKDVTREHFIRDSVATREHNIHESVASREQFPSDSVATGEQNQQQSVANLEAVKTDSVAVLDIDSVAKQFPKKRILPRSQHQVNLLLFLLEKQLNNDSISTPMLSRIQIAKATGMSQWTVKNTLDRLVDKKLLVRNGFSRACNRGGTVFSVSNYIRRELQLLAEQGRGHSVAKQNSNSVADDSVARPSFLSGSSRLNDLTTTEADGLGSKDRELAASFQELVNRLGLEDFGVGANDLISLWRRVLTVSGVFQDQRDLEASLDHLAFYLRSKDAEGITNPKAWMLKELQRGYYPEPSGYKSRAELAEEAKLADARKRKERVLELRRQRFEIEFDEWNASLAEDKRKKLLGGLSADSKLVRTVLRAAYARECSVDLEELFKAVKPEA